MFYLLIVSHYFHLLFYILYYCLVHILIHVYFLKDGLLYGLKILNEINIKPNHIVGDFDTVKSEILDLYKEDTSIKIHKFNPIKDNTDTDIAIRLAVEFKSDEIIILGAIGTRVDHLLGIYMFYFFC